MTQLGVVGAGLWIGDSVDEDLFVCGVLLTKLLFLSVAFDLCGVLAWALVDEDATVGSRKSKRK